MYRPAFSGNIVAKIACMTKPQMATVRTMESGGADVVCAVGKGAKNVVCDIQTLVQRKIENAEKEKHHVGMLRLPDRQLMRKCYPMKSRLVLPEKVLIL